jgi:hypothetical protein
MARFDIQAAHDLCPLLRARGGIDGHDWGAVAWGLWTGVVCSYARPFKRAELELKAPQWRTFEDPSLQQLHDTLIRLRDALFAHNDKTVDRMVVVHPPGAWGPEGSATESQSVFATSDIETFDGLFEYQLTRIAPEIRRLVAELCAGQTFSQGAEIELAGFPDRP